MSVGKARHHVATEGEDGMEVCMYCDDLSSLWPMLIVLPWYID